MIETGDYVNTSAGLAIGSAAEITRAAEERNASSQAAAASGAGVAGPEAAEAVVPRSVPSDAMAAPDMAQLPTNAAAAPPEQHQVDNNAAPPVVSG